MHSTRFEWLSLLLGAWLSCPASVAHGESAARRRAEEKTAPERMNMSSTTPLPLWPNGAPGLDTAEPQWNPTITPYPVPGTGPHSAIVILPGGGYAKRAPHESEPIARWLNGAGVAAFVCDYRVKPYRHPYPLLDAQRAIRWVRQNAEKWGVDPHRVGILGFSAGGHCAAAVGTHFDAGDPQATDPVDRQSCRPDCMVLCYPVISFGPQGHAGSRRNLLGDNPPQELIDNLSNEKQVTDETPPAFLWHTADDPGVPVANSLMFVSALGEHHVPFELHVFRSGRHGLGLAEATPHIHEWTRLCEQWLREIGF